MNLPVSRWRWASAATSTISPDSHCTSSRLPTSKSWPCPYLPAFHRRRPSVRSRQQRIPSSNPKATPPDTTAVANLVERARLVQTSLTTQLPSADWPTSTSAHPLPYPVETSTWCLPTGTGCEQFVSWSFFQAKVHNSRPVEGSQAARPTRLRINSYSTSQSSPSIGEP